MRLTYANVAASLALFVALGGTSYAVSRLPRNSVGSVQVRDGSLLPQDLASSAAAPPGSAIRGPRGAAGLSGPQGPPGVEGQRGPASVRVALQAATVTLPGLAGQPKTVRRMDNIPSGAWILRFQANAALLVPEGLYAVCTLKVNGDAKATGSAFVGQSGNATQEVGIAVENVVQQPAPFNVSVDCSQDKNSSPPVLIVAPQIIATQVADVVTTP